MSHTADTGQLYGEQANRAKVNPELWPPGYRPDIAMNQLLNTQQWKLVAEELGLTVREREVCELLFQCLTRREIAERLEIKDRTVRSYMEQIHAKLSVKNRVGIVLRVIEVRDSLEKR